MVSPVASKAYSGICDDGEHEPRRVTLLLRNANKYNDQTSPMVRCGECGTITKCEPDKDLLTEYMTDGSV